MSVAFLSIAEGIGAQIDTNNQCEFSTGYSAIDLVSIFLGLQVASSELLTQDAENIYTLSLTTIGQEGGSAQVAAATQQRNIDSTLTDQRTGNIDTLVQGLKAKAQELGNNLTNVLSFADPLSELMRTETDIIGHMR